MATDSAFQSCPVCGSGATEQYTEPPEARKFVCRRAGCLEIFQVSRPANERTPEQKIAEQIEEKATKAGVNLEDRVNDDGPSVREQRMSAEACAKGCGKVFKFESWRTKHESSCTGTPLPPSRRGIKKEKKEKLDPSYDPVTDVPPSKARKPRELSTNGVGMEEAIELLKKKRQRIVDDLIMDNPDIKALDIAIDALENRPT